MVYRCSNFPICDNTTTRRKPLNQCIECRPDSLRGTNWKNGKTTLEAEALRQSKLSQAEHKKMPKRRKLAATIAEKKKNMTKDNAASCSGGDRNADDKDAADAIKTTVKSVAVTAVALLPSGLRTPNAKRRLTAPPAMRSGDYVADYVEAKICARIAVALLPSASTSIPPRASSADVDGPRGPVSDNVTRCLADAIWNALPILQDSMGDFAGSGVVRGALIFLAALDAKRMSRLLQGISVNPLLPLSSDVVVALLLLGLAHADTEDTRYEILAMQSRDVKVVKMWEWTLFCAYLGQPSFRHKGW
jgi:hypothetical protein